MRLPALTLRPGRERSILNRHPWIFSGAILNMPEASKEGIIEVRDAKGNYLGAGFFHPESQIVCRMFYFSASQGSFSDEFWKNKFRAAYQFRKSFINPEITTGYRLANAEGDSLPGMIVDIYDKTAVLQMRIPGVLPLISLWVEFLKQEVGINQVILKKETEEGFEWLTPKVTDRVTFMENGFNFIAEIEIGQKTGFFLDQRNSRNLVGNWAQNKTVLNAFCYSGAFSIYALKGGAKEVISLDISHKAIQTVEEVIQLNFNSPVPHRAITVDTFEYLKEMPDDYFDLIILDPPAFTKHISTVNKAARGYKEINLKAMRKIKEGGILFTFSCSQHISVDLFRKIIYGAAADAGRECSVLYRLAQPEDHPVNIFHPEGEYLKGLVLRVGG
ncbi:MAG: class I SAM-dependent rRNA methyltransferase [Sphingobacteriia bacterium]|nr:class I SAM-dependent rRNA methyltransferase [Sphingobacteriia bacterium]